MIANIAFLLVIIVGPLFTLSFIRMIGAAIDRLCKKVYRIRFVTEDDKNRCTYFLRGYTWSVVEEATKIAADKPLLDGKKWAVDDITLVP